MNLQFTIAVHALAYLTKHKDQSFPSSSLAELICVNPVQLRLVMSKLAHEHLAETRAGKYGGYSAIPDSANIPLSRIFELFRVREADSRIFTGKPDSSCAIARNMSSVISDLREQEQELLINFYNKQTIGDILTTIDSKENSHD